MKIANSFAREVATVCLLVAPLAFSGCYGFPNGMFRSNGDASIHRAAEKDPFPSANEPPIESIKR